MSSAWPPWQPAFTGTVRSAFMPQLWDRLSHCPWLIALAAHVWSHLQPSNSPWQSMWGRFWFICLPLPSLWASRARDHL